MATSFKRSFIARWSDTDFNGHMRSTAFLDVASDVRLLFFRENGYSLDEFKKQNSSLFVNSTNFATDFHSISFYPHPFFSSNGKKPFPSHSPGPIICSE